MKLNNIQASEGSRHGRKRLGCGIGTGHGKTGGRGHKGQKSRSGGGVMRGFEGGQMPLQRRVPKFGFKNINRVAYKGINLDAIQTLIDSKKVKEITPDILIENGLISKNDLVKILGRGELKSKIDVKANGFSATAKSAIEKVKKAGGEIKVKEIKKIVTPIVENPKHARKKK